MLADERDLTRLLSSATLVLIGQLLYSFSKLGERVIIARLLDPDAYGEVSLSLAVMSIVVTIAMVGLRQGVPRYISRYSDRRDIRGTWLTGLTIAVGLGIGISLILALNAQVVVDHLFERADALSLIVLFAVAIPFVIGMEIGVGAVRGLENTIYRTYIRDLLYPGLRLLTLTVLLFAGVGVLSAGYAYLIAATVGFIAVHYLLNRLIPLVGKFRTHSRELLTFSVPLVLATLLSRLLTRTDTIMLGYFRPSYEVGLYSAAFPLASALVLVLSSFGFMYLPVASRLDSEDKRDEIDAIYKLTTKWIFILTFPAFLTLVVFPGDILTILFGPSYSPAATALAVLTLGFFTRAVFGRSRETISAMGYTKYLLLTNVFAFTLNFGLNLLLIPAHGPVGAAIASAASFIGLNLAVYAFLRYRFGITPFSKPMLRTMAVLPVSMAPLAVLVTSQVSLTFFRLVAFAISAEVSAIVLVAITGCLQAEDEIPIEFVETTIGVKIPLIWRFVPTTS